MTTCVENVMEVGPDFPSRAAVTLGDCPFSRREGALVLVPPANELPQTLTFIYGNFHTLACFNDSIVEPHQNIAATIDVRVVGIVVRNVVDIAEMIEVTIDAPVSSFDAIGYFCAKRFRELFKDSLFF